MNLQPEPSNEANGNSPLFKNKTIAVVGEQSTINANRIMADAKRSKDSLARIANATHGSSIRGRNWFPLGNSSRKEATESIFEYCQLDKNHN